MLEIFIETNRSTQQLAIAITTLIEFIVLLAILACQPNDTKQYPDFYIKCVALFGHCLWLCFSMK
ncbi:hypothetical protein DAHU10_015610 [Hanseniaspora uvarum]|nr:hypothetical protein DAHU10_015610 [Hanseniaspora uvarum]